MNPATDSEAESGEPPRHPSGRWRKRCGWLIAAAVAMSLYALGLKREVAALAPPAGVTDFESFAARAEPPHHLAILSSGSDRQIVWIGPLCGPVYLASGRSCYLFDAEGRLLDWTPNTGEGGPLDRSIRYAWGQPSLSIDDVREFLRTSGEEKDATSRVPAGAGFRPETRETVGID